MKGGLPPMNDYKDTLHQLIPTTTRYNRRNLRLMYLDALQLRHLTTKLNSLQQVYTTRVQQLELNRRFTNSDFYKQSYQTQIHKLNAKRELIKELLDDLKFYEP